jgi:hypothetical protein
MPGSASGAGEEGEKDGRLKPPPPHAPSNSANAEAAARLATVRA